MSNHNPTERDLAAEKALAEFRESQHAVDILSLDVLRKAILSIAHIMVGVTEKAKSNSSYWVDRFLLSVKLGPGQPWCMAFVQWVYAQACACFGADDILKHDSGSTRKVWDWAALKGLTETDPSKWEPGDILIWSNGASYQGHTAIITDVMDNPARVHTVEGNISDQSWREGGEVAEREYDVSEMRLRKPHSTKRWCRGAISLRKLYALGFTPPAQAGA